MRALVAALAFSVAGAIRDLRTSPPQAKALHRDRTAPPQGVLKRLTDDLVAHDGKDRAALCGLVERRHDYLVAAVRAESYHEAYVSSIALTADHRAVLAEQCGDTHLEVAHDGRHHLFLISDGSLMAGVESTGPTHTVVSLGDMSDLPMGSRIDVPIRGFVSPLDPGLFVMDHDETRIALEAETAGAWEDGSMIAEHNRRLSGTRNADDDYDRDSQYVLGRNGFMFYAVCHEAAAATDEECWAAHQAEHGNKLREWGTESWRTVANFYEANSRGRSTWFARMCPVGFAVTTENSPGVAYATNCANNGGDLLGSVRRRGSAITQCRIKKAHLSGTCPSGWVQEVGSGGDSDTPEGAAMSNPFTHELYCTKLNIDEAACEAAASVAADGCDMIMDQGIYPYGPPVGHDDHRPAAVCEWGHPCAIEDQISPSTGEPFYVFSGVLLDTNCGGRSWNGGGLGIVGWDGSWYATEWGQTIYDQGFNGVFAHEIGHNFGANHANYDLMEYGDNFDLMGGGGVPKGHWLGAGKRVFDFIDASEVEEFGPRGCPICENCRDDQFGDEGALVIIQSLDTFEFSGDEAIGHGGSHDYTGRITENWKYDDVAMYVDFNICEFGNGWGGAAVGHHFDAEVRSLYDSQVDVLQFRWIGVAGTEGAGGCYAGTQIIDITQSTPAQGDGGLAIGDTYVLDLDRSGIVVKFEAKLDDDKYQLRVWYVDPGSMLYELTDRLGEPRVNSKTTEVNDPYVLEELMCGTTNSYTLEGSEKKIFKIDPAMSLDPIRITSTVQPITGADDVPASASYFVHTQYPLGLMDFDGSAKNGAYAGAEMLSNFDYSEAAALGRENLPYWKMDWGGQRGDFQGQYNLMTVDEIAADIWTDGTEIVPAGDIEIAYKNQGVMGYWWYMPHPNPVFGMVWYLGSKLGENARWDGQVGSTVCVIHDCDNEDIAGSVNGHICQMGQWRFNSIYQNCGGMSATVTFEAQEFVAELREEVPFEDGKNAFFMPYSHHNYLSLVNNKDDVVTTIDFDIECEAINTQHCARNRYRDGSECSDCPEGTEAPAGSTNVLSCVSCPENSFYSMFGERCMACADNAVAPAGSIGEDSCVSCWAGKEGELGELFTAVTISNPTACEVIEVSGTWLAGTFALWANGEDGLDYDKCTDAGADLVNGGCIENAGFCMDEYGEADKAFAQLGCTCDAGGCGSYQHTGTCNIDSIRDIEGCEGYGMGDITCTNDGMNGHIMTVTSIHTVIDVQANVEEGVEEESHVATHVVNVAWGNPADSTGTDADGIKIMPATMYAAPVGNSAEIKFCLPKPDSGEVEITWNTGDSDGEELTYEVNFCTKPTSEYGSGVGAVTLDVAAIESCGDGETPRPTLSKSPIPAPTAVPVPAPTQVPFPAPTISPVPTPHPTYPMPTVGPCMEITMEDTFGDGWTNNYLDVYDCDGTKISPGDGFTLDAAYGRDPHTVELCVGNAKGYMVEAFAAGQYANECKWSITHPNGAELIDKGIPFEGMLGDCYATDAPSPAPTPRPPGAPTHGPTVSLSPTPAPVQVEVSVELEGITAEEFDEPCRRCFCQAMMRSCGAVQSVDQVVILQVTNRGRRLDASGRRLDDGAGIEIDFAIIPPESADDTAGDVWAEFAAEAIQDDIVADGGELLLQAILVVAEEIAEETGEEPVALAAVEEIGGIELDAFVPEPTTAPTATVSPTVYDGRDDVLLEEVEALAENVKASEDYTGGLVGAIVGVSAFWGLALVVYKKFFKGGKLRSSVKKEKTQLEKQAAQLDEMHRMVRQMSAMEGALEGKLAAAQADAAQETKEDGGEVVAAESVVVGI